MSIDKYTRAPVATDEINTDGHHMVGVIWPVAGSKENVYDVEMIDKGFTCTCPSFAYRGKCKHIVGIIARLCDEDYPRYQIPC